MSDGPSIRDEITIDAPPATVFHALTDADELGSWMATRATSEPRVGGHFRYDFAFADAAQNNAQEGEYLAFEPDTRLALPWRFPFSPEPTTVIYELSGDHGVTRVRFSHTGFGEGEPWDTARARFGPGWRAFLESLKRWVEDHTEGRPIGIQGPAQG